MVKLKNIIDEGFRITGRNINYDGIFLWQHSNKSKSFKLVSHWIFDNKAKNLPKHPKLKSKKFPLIEPTSEQNLYFIENTIIPREFRKGTFGWGSAKTIALLPILGNQTYFGFLALENYRNSQHWSEKDIHAIEAVSRYISKSIIYHYLEELNQKLNQKLAHTKYLLKKEKIERKKLLTTLCQKDKDLISQKMVLAEVDATLSVFQRQKKKDIANIEEKLLYNLNSIVLPALSKLKGAATPNIQQKWIHVLESNLSVITSRFAQKPTSQQFRLTTTEIRITDLIRQGYATRTIAQMLEIAIKTVETHRLNIRRKLGLSNTKRHLRTYLLSLQ